MEEVLRGMKRSPLRLLWVQSRWENEKEETHVCDVSQNGSKLKQPKLQFKRDSRNSVNSGGGTYSSTEGQSLISSASESDVYPMKRIRDR